MHIACPLKAGGYQVILVNNIATVLETHGCHVLPGIHEMCKIKIVGK